MDATQPHAQLDEPKAGLPLWVRLLSPEWPSSMRFAACHLLLFIAVLPLAVYAGNLSNPPPTEHWGAPDYIWWQFPLMAGALGWVSALAAKWAMPSKSNPLLTIWVVAVGGNMTFFFWLLDGGSSIVRFAEQALGGLVVSIAFWPIMLGYLPSDCAAGFHWGWAALSAAFVFGSLVARVLGPRHPRLLLALAMLGWPIAAGLALYGVAA